MRTIRKGITLYPGLSDTPAKNLNLIEQAVKCGITRIILTLVLPYADMRQANDEFHFLIKAARRYNMDVATSLTPETMKALRLKKFSLRSLKILGIRTLQINNFNNITAKDIAELSRNKQSIQIQFNASRVTQKTIDDLISARPNIKQLEAIHNVYPREGTGLSEENLIQKTVMLHKVGISVSAFVPSSRHHSPPLRAGLPSLESHRHISTDLACRHFAAIGMDSIFISDVSPSDEELFALGHTSGLDIAIKINPRTSDPLQLRLLKYRFTARFDEARDAVRAKESEKAAELLGGPILPENNVERRYGDITIDNETCIGFMGELQIIKRPSPASPRTNVAAAIREEETFLINYIMPGRTFRFLT